MNNQQNHNFLNRQSVEPIPIDEIRRNVGNFGFDYPSPDNTRKTNNPSNLVIGQPIERPQIGQNN